MTEIEEIEEAEKRCREAWAAAPDATWAWCCHHEVRVEPLFEPAQNRIDYIITFKATAERVARLDNFRPVLSPVPERLVEAWKAYGEARKSCKEARKAYEEAGKSYEEARKAYGEARKSYKEAWKAYGEAWKAYGEAMKAYDVELNAAHSKDVPNNTWNGNSIFKTQ